MITNDMTAFNIFTEGVELLDEKACQVSRQKLGQLGNYSEEERRRSEVCIHKLVTCFRWPIRNYPYSMETSVYKMYFSEPGFWWRKGRSILWLLHYVYGNREMLKCVLIPEVRESIPVISRYQTTLNVTGASLSRWHQLRFFGGHAMFLLLTFHKEKR